jgi:hypothetical protein
MSEKIEKYYLDGLPSGMLQKELLPYLANRDLVPLSQVSSTMFNCSSSRLITELMSLVVKGKEDQALKMIEANPRLLLISSQAKDYSGRIIKGTAFQAALGAEDEIMVKKMLMYFDKIKGLEKGEVLRQFRAQFKEGLDVAVKVNIDKAYNFHDLVNVRINGDENAIEQALEKFKKDLTFQAAITHGTHFNMYHLINAYQAYFDNFDRLANWENREWFIQKVIGFTQRQMPAYYAQIYCYYKGIWSERRLRDSLNFKNCFFYTSDYAVVNYPNSRGPGQVVHGEPKMSIPTVCSWLESIARKSETTLQTLEAELVQGVSHQPK